ncbi:MAG: ABC transporter ATP-binding protein [Acidobacteriota bacterium]|nr:ABC transporter ATP-binding protein [Acidobacteriota bacterium]
MKIILRILSYLRPYKLLILATCGLSLVVLLLQGISIWVGARFLQGLLGGATAFGGPANVGGLAAFMDRLAAGLLKPAAPFRSLIYAVVILLLAGLLTSAFRLLKVFLFARMNQNIVNLIRREMFVHLTRLDLSFSRKFRAGEVTSLFLQDAELIKRTVVEVADTIFMQPLRLIMALALMFSLSPRLTLILLGFLLLTGFTIRWAGGRIEALTRKLMEGIAGLQGHLTEYLSQVIVARSLGVEEYETAVFEKECRTLAGQTVRQNVVRSLAPQLITTLYVLAGGVLLLLGGYQVLVEHSLNGGVLLKMMLLVPMATYPIEALATLYISLRESSAGARRIFALLDEPGTSQDAPGAAAAPPLRNALEFRHVSYAVDGQTILDDVSFTAPRLAKVVIYGPSGAGKTTVLSLIAGFIRPTRGSILIDGVDMGAYTGTSWRRRLGIVIQEPILLNGTIRENLRYAGTEAGDEEFIEALRAALLWNETSVLPLGLDTPVGNRGEFLSGGERQRLTIARALLRKPDVFLMDEPTTQLDHEAQLGIRETMASVSRGKTLFIATHDASLRAMADIEIRLEGGRLAAMTAPSSREKPPA